MSTLTSLQPYCPSVEELAQFLRGELDHEADLNVAHHLTVCEYCPESLALMDSTPTDIWPEQTPDWFSQVQVDHAETIRSATTAAHAIANPTEYPAAQVRRVLKSLAEWTVVFPFVPNPVWSNSAAIHGKEWTLTIGEAQGMSPVSMRLVCIDDKGNSKRLLIQSDNPSATYLVRAFSADRKLFEKRVKGMQPAVTQMDGDFEADNTIEIVEFMES